MGIQKFLKNKIKDYNFIKNKRKLKINHFDLNFFKNYSFSFAESENPEVSIIIPVYNQIQYTLNCLYTLDQFDKNISKEIIIINDNSTDETIYLLNKISGIKVVSNKENLGFLRNVNKGISLAKGEFVYILNNDVEVQENYLSSLLKVFKEKPNVGAVGSKMVFSDNTLQEAGCLIFKDLQIVNLGRGGAIDNPKFNFLRKVDYCSGCSLLFKRKDAEGNLNLLDEAFLPAYYEETDLCQRIIYKQNLDIYYQPQSEIIHFENISYKDNGKNAVKEALLEKNREIFKSRWGHYFNDKMKIKEGKINYNRHFSKPNFLFLEETMPKPDKDSGSRRFLELVKILLKNRHHVVLAVKMLDEEKDLRYADYFRQLGVEVCLDYVSPKNKIVKLLDQVSEALHYVDIVWIFRPLNFNYWYPYIKDDLKGKKLIYDMVDLHYLRMERENQYIETGKNRDEDIMLVKAREYEAMLKADAVVSISDQEKNIVAENGVSENKIFTVSNIHQIVEGDFKGFNERKDILFIGGYKHLPNIDAVEYLFKEIMPRVWSKNPDISVKILGADFPENLKEKMHSDKFQILGYQKTVDSWFHQSKLFVAPLRYGAGVKGKIGQALEFKLPVVTSPIGAEGMDLQNGVSASIASHDDPDIFAAKIVELYETEDLWNKLHHNSVVPLSQFSIETQEENIKKMLKYLGF